MELHCKNPKAGGGPIQWPWLNFYMTVVQVVLLYRLDLWVLLAKSMRSCARQQFSHSTQTNNPKYNQNLLLYHFETMPGQSCSAKKTAKMKSYIDHICNVLMEYDKTSLYWSSCKHNNWNAPKDLWGIANFKSINIRRQVQLAPLQLQL